MELCVFFRERLVQYIADGEGSSSPDGALQQHLAQCARCRAYAEDLRAVEAALRSYPLIGAPATLRARLIETIVKERQASHEEWRLLPWDVWVPALAFGLAFLIALVSLPGQFWQASSALEALDLSGRLSAWLASLHLPAEEGLFWAIWVGIFATTAGLGLCLSLTNWTRDHTRRLEDLETHVADTVTRLWDQTRRAH